MGRILQIHSRDNVAVALSEIAKGERLTAGELEVAAAETIPQGHKIALKAIAAGENGGMAVYFPRRVTGEIEEEKKYEITFSRTEDGMTFPETTPLLPRSGNINKETGLGEYWGAGTVLEFLRSLNREGSIVILITHDNGIAATARRIVRLADGKIVEDREQEVDWL